MLLSAENWRFGGRNGNPERRLLSAESPISNQEQEGSDRAVENVLPDAAEKARPAAFSNPAPGLLAE